MNASSMLRHAEDGLTDLDQFEHDMSVRGWVLFPGVLPGDLCDRMRADIAQHVRRCGEIQVKIGIPGAPDGTAHHTVGFGDSLDEFLERAFLHAEVTKFFKGPYILHAFNPVLIQPAMRNYVHRIHKDVRTHIESFRLMLNMLVMVDEFTLENGATYVMSGSHGDPSQPDEADFFRSAERLTGPRGSIVLFDSRLWHAAGDNVSSRGRAALTLSLSRPFLKPQMDYARLIGNERGEKLSEPLRQILGFNARVPTTLDEWYRPAGSRMYLPNQG